MRSLYKFAPVAIAAVLAQAPIPAHAQISFGLSVPGIGVRIGVPLAPVAVIQAQTPPPPLVDYDQPPIPGDGYIWTPGYWAYDPSTGYYWVPGTWVEPPSVGLLWTPGYWAWGANGYIWNDGYWGPHVGFYGGVNYGWGYGGDGYWGGRWDGGRFRYNGEYNNFGGRHFDNAYRQHFGDVHGGGVAFNGGNGGIDRRPTADEQNWAHEQHFQRTPDQVRNRDAARSNPEFRENENHGRPPVAATARPGEFSGQGVVTTHETTTTRESITTHETVTNHETVARPAPEVNRGEPSEAARPAYRPEERQEQYQRPAQQEDRSSYARPAQEARPSYPQPVARSSAPPQAHQVQSGNNDKDKDQHH